MSSPATDFPGVGFYFAALPAFANEMAAYINQLYGSIREHYDPKFGSDLIKNAKAEQKAKEHFNAKMSFDVLEFDGTDTLVRAKGDLSCTWPVLKCDDSLHAHRQAIAWCHLKEKAYGTSFFEIRNKPGKDDEGNLQSVHVIGYLATAVCY